jgi:hypothetical protein
MTLHSPLQPRVDMSFGDDAMRAKLLKNIKSDACYFYIVGGLQILLWFVLGHLWIVDGLINVGLSFLVHRFRSRVAAIFLLVVSVLGVMFGFMAIAMLGARPGIIYPIALVIRVLTSARMVYATFKLNSYVVESKPQWLPPPPPEFQPQEEPWTVSNTAVQWQPSETSY